MKKEFYFKDEDSEICYTKDHFEDVMRFDKVTEMEVVEAIPDKIDGIFWCKAIAFCGDNSSDTCGKQCKHYAPRNGKSGCCKHYTTRIYTWGDKVTLKLDPCTN